jgi:phosphatidylglycerol:prolipoprotein diacylglycerol transferase
MGKDQDMYPIFFENSQFALPAWHLFYALAALCGYLVFQFLIKTYHPELERHTRKIFLTVYVSGYFGARAFSLLVEQSSFPWEVGFWLGMAQIGSMTLYGGILLGGLATTLLLIALKIPLFAVWDALVIAGLVAIGVGRIGCFLNGDDYGIALQNQTLPAPWWAVAFPNHEERIYRVPIQLFETIGCWALATWAMTEDFRKYWSSGFGKIGISFALAYAVLRFGLEFWRGDDRGVFLSPIISPAQWISLIAIIGLTGVPLLAKKLQ